MNLHHILKFAFLHAVLAAGYVTAVAFFMSSVPTLLGGEPPDFMGGALFLLVFVISAAVMGLLIFARPLMWYINGAKREAIWLAIYTVGCLAGIAILLFLLLLSTAR